MSGRISPPLKLYHLGAHMYTKIPNAVFDVLPELSGTQTKVLLAIYRATAGWQRETASLSLSTLAKMTGASVRQISDALCQLESRKLIERVYSTTGFVYRTFCNAETVAETAIEETAIEKTATKVLQKLPTNKERKESNTTVSNDTVRKRKPRTKRETEAVETERTPLSIYRHYHRLQVPIAIRDMVSQITDLDKWEAICKEWIARGYKPGNVQACMQVYEKGWNTNDKRRKTQRGDVQREQRESKLEQYFAEYQL